MNDEKVDQLRQDVATIEHALAIRPGVGYEQVKSNLFGAFLGVLIIALTLLGSARYVAAVFFLLVAVHAAWWIRVGTRLRRTQAIEPQRWREYRRERKVTLIVLPLIVAFILWMGYVAIGSREVNFSAWARYIAGPFLFYSGTGCMVLALLDQTRLYKLGYAIPAILFAFAAPWCTTFQHAWLWMGSTIGVAGLATAAILGWQLRRWETCTTELDPSL